MSISAANLLSGTAEFHRMFGELMHNNLHLISRINQLEAELAALKPKPETDAPDAPKT